MLPVAERPGSGRLPKEPRQGDDDRDRMEKVVDPETGKDVTIEQFEERAEALRRVADYIIEDAVERWRAEPSRKLEIFNRAYWNLQQKVGAGYMGPATAAVRPIIDGKMKELAERLEMTEDELRAVFSRELQGGGP